HVTAGLTGSAIQAHCLAIEQTRTVEQDQALAASHGFLTDGLLTTPLMYQAAQCARARGVFAFDRLERDFFPFLERWRHPDVSPGIFTLRRTPEQVHTHPLWPFVQDASVADYQIGQPAKWWSHGLVHAMIGFGWWPTMTEWDVMHMARLNEAVAAVHWYWLAEIGRADGPNPYRNFTNLDAADSALFHDLEQGAQDPSVRRSRVSLPASADIAGNALEILNYEAFCYRSGVHHGQLVEPDAGYIALGEACDYARVNHRRLMSTSHARWREACLEPGLDFATSAVGFEQRVADVLGALLRPAPEDITDAPRRRARRVLQDMGSRLCHQAALEGQAETGYTDVLAVLSQGLVALRNPGSDPDAEVVLALEAMTHIAPAKTPDGHVDILALGYRPLSDDHSREPERSTWRRAEALRRRAWAYTPAIGTAVDGTRPVAVRVVATARGENLIDELTSAADAAAKAEEISYMAEAYVGYLSMPEQAWGPPQHYGTPTSDAPWLYRMAQKALPTDALEAYVVQLNPYLSYIPMSFDPRWSEQVLKTPRDSDEPLRPIAASAAYYALAGPGREAPVYVPGTPQLQGLLGKLKAPKRLNVLLSMNEVTEERLKAAVESEVVLVLHRPFHDLAETEPNQYVRWMKEATERTAASEPPGPWQEVDQAEAYAAFCETSTLYRDVSNALADALRIPPNARVADLGFGTGETSRAVLARLGPQGSLVGVDPAPRLVTRMVERNEDDRARFLVGASRTLAEIAAREAPFTVALSNASIWLAPDIAHAIQLLRLAVAPGGELGISIPAEYLGQFDHVVTPNAVQLGAAISTAKQALPDEPAATEGEVDAALSSQEAFFQTLVAAGFTDPTVTVYRRPWPASEYISWLAQPVVLRGMTGQHYETHGAQFIAQLRELVPADLALESAWCLISATRDDD
ncbi:MAG: SAM-dependent methyltransferase, partial [Myxococcota bacterium]